MNELLYRLENVLVFAVYFLPTILTLVWFIISLVLYRKTPKDHPKYKTRLVLLIVSASLAGFFFLVEGGILTLFLIAIKNM